MKNRDISCRITGTTIRTRKRMPFVSTLLLLAFVPFIMASASAEEHRGDPKSVPALSRLASAMGGLRSILELRGMELVVAGRRVEPEQAFRPGGTPIPMVDYQIVHTQAFNGQKMRTEWASSIHYPLVVERQFTEIINDDRGAILGVDSFLNAPASPMSSYRIASRTKQRLLESPLAFIHYAADHPRQVFYKVIKQKKQPPRRMIVIVIGNETLRLHFQPGKRFPVKADSFETDPVYGDALWEVYFDDWIRVDDVWVPTQLTQRLDGRVIHEQKRNSVRLLKTLDEAVFSVPDELTVAINPNQYSFGRRYSQWLNRFLAAGIPADIDQTDAASVAMEEISPGLFHVLAPIHRSLIVEMDDYLVMLEAPLHDERTQAVLAAVNNRWPNKPIKYVVTSHFHNDHSGGIRGYGAIGATLIVAENIKAYMEGIFASKHIRFPDRYSLHPKPVKIETVSADVPLSLKQGERALQIIDIPNRHAKGMLITYIEDAKTVFVADLYNPEFFPDKIPPQFDGWAIDLLDGLEKTGLEIEQIVGAHGGQVSYQRLVSDVQALRP